jgi:hypothetical protein
LRIILSTTRAQQATRMLARLLLGGALLVLGAEGNWGWDSAAGVGPVPAREGTSEANLLGKEKEKHGVVQEFDHAWMDPRFWYLAQQKLPKAAQLVSKRSQLSVQSWGKRGFSQGWGRLWPLSGSWGKRGWGFLGRNSGNSLPLPYLRMRPWGKMNWGQKHKKMVPSRQEALDRNGPVGGGKLSDKLEQELEHVAPSRLYTPGPRGQTVEGR